MQKRELPINEPPQMAMNDNPELGEHSCVKQIMYFTWCIFAVQSIQMKGHHLADIDKIPLEKDMDFEVQGTMEDARIQGIPLAQLSVATFSPHEIGALVAFWQLFAVYSAALRKVNPFDQPQVENSKNISFNKRLAFKGLL